MADSRILTLGLVALAVLSLLCVQCHGPDIEADVATRTAAALATAGVPTAVEAQVDGRDVTLTGVVASSAERTLAVDTATATRGVRAVFDRLKTGSPRDDDAAAEGSAEPQASGDGEGALAAGDGPNPAEAEDGLESTEAAPPGAATAHLDLSRPEDRWVCSGLLPDDGAKARVLRGLRSAYGDAGVEDRIRVDAGTPWAQVANFDLETRLPPILNRIEDTLGSPGLRLEGSTLEVRGRGDGLTGLAQLQDDLADLAPGWSVDDEGVSLPNQDDSELIRDLNDFVRLRSIRFASASDRLLPESERVLDRIARLLRDHDAGIEVQGHTDASGNAEFNQRLSQQRAEAVRNALVARGVDGVRLRATGFGSSRPVADNDTAEGRRQNRRVEFQILEEKS
ncbi:MAG: OmpA family protein [Acidobacteriota bacterium]